jgi:hypothetical protein
MKPAAATLVVLAALLLGAHFLRAGSLVLAAASVLAPLLLLVRSAVAARALQVALALGCVEWLSTLASLVDSRRASGQPVVRLAAILGGVALVTAAAALLAPRARRETISRS